MARRKPAPPPGPEVDTYQGPPPDGSVPLFTIDLVEDSTMLGTSGGFQRAKRVYFTVAGGTKSYVEIPLTDFKASTVNAAIIAHVADLAEVMALEGPAVPKPA